MASWKIKASQENTKILKNTLYNYNFMDTSLNFHVFIIPMWEKGMLRNY